jgi:hypothetical protein
VNAKGLTTFKLSRYVIACFLQGAANITINQSLVPSNRFNFNLTEFVAGTGDLTLVGATFFYVGPAGSTATNSNTSLGNNPTASSILSNPSTTTTAGNGYKNEATSLSAIASYHWSAVAYILGGAFFLLNL